MPPPWRAPRGGRHPNQQYIQQDAVGKVEGDIDCVMPTGAQAEQLAIEYVREPRERVPIRAVKRRETPDDSLPIDALLDRRVLRHIGTVVVVEKLEVRRLAIDGNDHQQQKAANGQRHTRVLRRGPTSGKVGRGEAITGEVVSSRCPAFRPPGDLSFFDLRPIRAASGCRRMGIPGPTETPAPPLRPPFTLSRKADIRQLRICSCGAFLAGQPFIGR